jgi:hypothetical protein
MEETVEAEGATSDSERPEARDLGGFASNGRQIGR